MEIEIRPVASGEVEAFIRAVPGAAGLPHWEPEPAAWWAGPGNSSPFGSRISDKELARYRSEVRELDRTQAAFADGKLVGTSGLYTLEVTVPGARQVAMGGVTSVGVLPTHRRRGLLRGMMRAMLDDCYARGEMLAGLGASEGSIYGRYGFGPATGTVRWELDRARARLASGCTEWPGRLELVDGARHGRGCASALRQGPADANRAGERFARDMDIGRTGRSEAVRPALRSGRRGGRGRDLPVRPSGQRHRPGGLVRGRIRRRLHVPVDAARRPGPDQAAGRGQAAGRRAAALAARRQPGAAGDQDS